MCLEDLRLGKGRTTGTPASCVTQNVLTQMLHPDANRVALVLSYDGLTGNVPSVANPEPTVAIWTIGTDPDNPLTIFQSPYNSPITLEIEKHGSLVTGNLSVELPLNGYLSLQAIAIPIISYVNAPPIAR